MFFLLPFIAMGQTYKYIGIEDGLSNRRIFNIQKDSKGYMWFLTNEGMDRYNGKEIKHYKLADEENKRNAQNHLTWLFREKENLWIVGKTGKIFEYHHQFDRFIPTYKPANLSLSISYSYLDNRGNIWLCDKDSIQAAAPVDSFAVPEPWDMPGYDSQVIMAAGAFISGASIELSADGPLREPYTAFFQGGLTWNHARFGILKSLQQLVDKGIVKVSDLC